MKPTEELYIPENAGPPVRLVVMFHGAGQTPRSVAPLLEPYAREHGFALLLPKSSGPTWDAILGPPGPDLLRLESLIADAAARVPIDEQRISVAGFSDGASYALGVGVAFGDRFDGVVAFSPGFVTSVGPRRGKPRIFVSHGLRDGVLPIGRTSRRLVPALRKEGYDVEYEEYDGTHAVPPSIARTAVDWLRHER
jgi:phospholipase/carboxylesterase